RAVLINPSVRPQDFMPDYLDVDLKSYHTDDYYRLRPQHVDEILTCQVAVQRAANYWLLVQTGDETLDYRQAVEKYHGCKQVVEPGGDHSFQGFERYIKDSIAVLEAGEDSSRYSAALRFQFYIQIYPISSLYMANYSAEDIEVLTGLDPVKKRPGMYTETTRPYHLAQEIIDNSVDE